MMNYKLHCIGLQGTKTVEKSFLQIILQNNSYSPNFLSGII